MPQPLYAFDLDGTITTQEILPRIAERAGVPEFMARLTELTLSGAIPFERSFRLRFGMLARVPLEQIHAVMRAIPLDPDIVAFIRARRSRCVIVTGNLDCWIEPLVQRLGCACLCSRSRFATDGSLELVSVLNKRSAVRELVRLHTGPLVAIGDSVNDIPMFEESQYAIAFAGVHAPLPALVGKVDHLAVDGAGLCRFMTGLESRLCQTEQ